MSVVINAVITPSAFANDCERVCIITIDMISNTPALNQEITINFLLRIRIEIIMQGAVNTIGIPSNMNAVGCVVLLMVCMKYASGSANSITADIKTAEADTKVILAAIVFSLFGNIAPMLNPVNNARKTRRSCPNI